MQCPPTPGPGLRILTRGWRLARSIAAPEPADTFIICVPTPITREKRADLDAVRHAARAILPCMKKGCLVVLESTSPVGTTRHVVGKILSEGGLVPGVDF